MLNRQQINANTIKFAAFTAETGNKVGDGVEVSMGGPYTAKRFVISLRERHADADKVQLTAVAIETAGLFELDPVAGTVAKCGAVVAHYVFDEIANLHYIGTDMENPRSDVICAESARDALAAFVA